MIAAAIAGLDALLSKQLAAIMHAPAFQRLEGTWRGLFYLVTNTETGELLKIRVLNISKKELFDDLNKAIEFDRSQIFRKVYEAEFGMPGGTPYGALLGDYEFEHHPDDIQLLTKMSNVAAAAFCPFIAAASPSVRTVWPCELRARKRTSANSGASATRSRRPRSTTH